jgi:AraC-like DNA-binding protein
VIEWDCGAVNSRLGGYFDYARHEDTMLGGFESLGTAPLKETKTKDERVYRNYHGEFINSRIVKGLLLAEASYAPKLELPEHAHRHGGFRLILEGGYTESYGRTLFECEDESPLLIEGLVLELIAETSRSRRRQSEGNPPLWLRQARELINDQFAHPLTLSLIAKFVGVHPVYLASLFRRYYRQSVGEYLRRRRRVEFACHKIQTSNDPLAEIALAAGFASQSHFTHTFKRVTGMSPAKYRSARRPS